MRNIACIILAAGEGTRMKSGAPKVLHPICGKAMIQYLLDNVKSLDINKVAIIVGHKAKLLKEELKEHRFIVQPQLLGTADAVMRTKDLFIKDRAVETLLILYGDTPLLRQNTLGALLDKHSSSKAACTMLTASLKNPTGYGRIKRSGNNKIVKIIEELDASVYDKVIEEVNVGVYCFNKKALFEALGEIKPANKKKEYYLTDAVGVLSKRGMLIESVLAQDPWEFLGVNTRGQLSDAERIVKKRILEDIMDSGVTVIDPDNTHIQGEVEIGKDSIIYPYTFIEKGVKIGSLCKIGPFARLRGASRVGDRVEIGNFVEIVRSSVGDDTKVKHHSYIGDTVIGKSVNIGAGTIVANYDGKKKHTTFIEDASFIGSGTILVAPVKIGKGAVTGAGSVVTKNKDVPAGKTVVGIPAKILKKKRG